MATVTVHRFEIWDINRGDWVREPLQSTAERIMEATQNKGRIVPGTAEEVDCCELDMHGRYNPQNLGEGEPPVEDPKGCNPVMAGASSPLVNRLVAVRSLERSC